MSQAESPIPLAAGVKCPYCPRGVFRERTRVTLDPNGREVQHWWWQCDHYQGKLWAPRTFYMNAPVLGDDGYWAVVGDRVKVVRRAAN